jgi:hypothetical protein
LAARLATQNRIFPIDQIGWEYYDGNFPLFVPDDPLSPEEMQSAIRQIMGRFYRFRSMFAIARNICIFPAMVFSLWNIQFGWRRWRRLWRYDLMRFGGWLTIRRWTSQFRSGSFSQKLTHAKREMTTG